MKIVDTDAWLKSLWHNKHIDQKQGNKVTKPSYRLFYNNK